MVLCLVEVVFLCDPMGLDVDEKGLGKKWRPRIPMVVRIIL